MVGRMEDLKVCLLVVHWGQILADYWDVPMVASKDKKGGAMLAA